MLEKIGEKFKTANEALADAHKTWRSDQLADREKRLSERETTLSARESELERRLQAFQLVQGKAWLRRIAFGTGAIVLICVAFVVGSMTASSLEGAPALVPTPPRSEATPEAREVGTVSETGPRASTLSFRECVERGDAYFQEIGSWPVLTSTGEDAHSAAIERCGRTTTAFGPW